MNGIEGDVKLDGVMIWVADVPATVAFYEAAFGLEVAVMVRWRSTVSDAVLR